MVIFCIGIDTEYSAGRLQGAITASRMAKTINYTSLASGAVTVVIFAIYILIHVVTG